MNSDASTIGTSPAEGLGTAYSGSWGYSANDVDSIRVFRDGTQMTSFPLCAAKKDDAFPVLQQTLGVLFSTSNGTTARKVPGDYYVPSGGANYKLDPIISQGARRFNIQPAWGMGNLRGGSIFQPAAFVWGVSARKCSDDNIANQGVYCQQLQLVVDSGASTAGTHYLFYIFSSAFAVDANGNCVVKR